jgi:hypothetical protein
MAHLGALPHPVTSDVHEYASGLRDTTVHPTCIHTLHSFRPLTPKSNAWPPISESHGTLQDCDNGRPRGRPEDRLTCWPSADPLGIEGSLLHTSCSYQRIGS